MIISQILLILDEFLIFLIVLIARQRLEMLALVRKKYGTFEEAIEFLKENIPVTNPVTISLVNEIKFLYPITTAEMVKFGALAAVSAAIEISSTSLDLYTDIKLALKPIFDNTCESIQLVNETSLECKNAPTKK